MLRYDPFSDLSRMTEQLLAPTGRAPRFMPMDLYRSEDHYVLHADLPGVDPGSVAIDVENGSLTITAERSQRTDDGVQWIANERFTGTLRRQLSLGDGIDTERISATYANGVLTVTIPVADRAKPRRVSISTDTAQTSIAPGAHEAGRTVEAGGS